MNRELFMLRLLHELSNFRYFDGLITEILDLLAQSGKEAAFLSLLTMRLRQLSVWGIYAAEHEGFENIGGGLFSLHLQRKEFNIRILYAFLPNSQPVLLLAFYERAGKKKTDYTPYISPALSRFKRIKEAYDHE